MFPALVGRLSGIFVSSTQVAYGVARRCFAVAALVAPVLFGCATPPTDPAERAAFEQTNDPRTDQPQNPRGQYGPRQVLLRPIAKAYVTVLPDDARDALRRVLDNLKEPVVIINNVLQGRAEGATISAARFAVNSTIGMVGIMDVAAKWGLEKQPADSARRSMSGDFRAGPTWCSRCSAPPMCATRSAGSRRLSRPIQLPRHQGASRRRPDRPIRPRRRRQAGARP